MLPTRRSQHTPGQFISRAVTFTHNFHLIRRSYREQVHFLLPSRSPVVRPSPGPTRLQHLLPAVPSRSMLARKAFPVNLFGAKGDGKTDDTVAIQSAINTAAAAGGGSVILKVARYFTSGTLQVPTGVVLCGSVEGPFDIQGVNPSTTAIAPTLLITNSSGPFITLQGIGAGVTDLLFHYPNQVLSSASAPSVYPYTIQMNSPGTKVVRSTVTNAYNFLDIEIGRAIAHDLFIGAFNVGVNIDNSYDFVSLRNLHNGVFWDEA